ncbi:hypothetical protein Bhyg_02618 [Pseudolycoriella hygida]|uniref:Uncharacterized protein n=1 Tax=Pseudolycoriella hygida TaxID=35572 RepID=A0A9Q0NBR4_9DIPT|nr:hypothetical protein Bhyg_02618 [Pseudolycoriella hygida]
MNFNRERQHLLDVKTRWNSLANLLERFYELRNCIEKALVDIDPDLRLTQEDFKLIGEIGKALKPVHVETVVLNLIKRCYPQTFQEENEEMETEGKSGSDRLLVSSPPKKKKISQRCT